MVTTRRVSLAVQSPAKRKALLDEDELSTDTYPTNKKASTMLSPNMASSAIRPEASGTTTGSQKGELPNFYWDTKSGSEVGKEPLPNQPRKMRGSRTLSIPSDSAQLIEHFKSCGILVWEPSQLEYERSVASTNLLYRYTRPDCVVQPQNAGEVQEIVVQCRKHNKCLTVKTGGHSYAGFSTTEKGILLDMHRMNGTDLDMKNEVVYADGGALWADVYKRLINGRHNGFAVNGGRCPTVGVSGFLMGSGLGPFTRSLGMGSDSVLSVTLVMADGRLQTVGVKDDPKSPEGELFWALCGGGGGNFGVVVQWKLRVEKLHDAHGMVSAGRYTWDYRPGNYGDLPPAEQNMLDNQFMKTMDDFYNFDWPDQITIDSTWIQKADDTKGIEVRFLSYCDGDARYFGKWIDRAVINKDINKQLKRRCMEEKSTRFLHETLVAQWNEETVRSLPTTREFRLYAGFALKDSQTPGSMKPVVRVVKEELEEFGRLFRGEQAECFCSFIHTGGAARDLKQRHETAYRWREASYQAYIMIVFQDKWVERDMRGFLAKFKARLKPHSLTGHAVFINFPDAALPHDAYEKAYYGENREKLQQIKHHWDPSDFFHGPQSIRLPAKKTKKAQREAEKALSNVDPEEDWEVNDERDLTDQMAAERWESLFDVPANDWLPNADQMYPTLDPGIQAKDIDWLYFEGG